MQQLFLNCFIFSCLRWKYLTSKMTDKMWTCALSNINEIKMVWATKPRKCGVFLKPNLSTHKHASLAPLVSMIQILFLKS